MSDSSQYSFAGMPPSACPAPEDSGEKAPPESLEKESESEESGTSVVRVEEVKVVTPGSSRPTSPVGASVGDVRAVRSAGGGSSQRAVPQTAATVIATTGREDLIRPRDEKRRTISAEDIEVNAR